MSKKKSILMETTEISPERSAGEIQIALVEAGARHIQMDYALSGKIVGMNFVLVVNGVPQPFRLPARVEALKRLFKERRVKTTGFSAYKFEARDAEQAERVAWRQLLRWTQAQLALIQTEMVQAEEVFTPYLLEAGGSVTLFEHLQATRFKALPPGKEA